MVTPSICYFRFYFGQYDDAIFEVDGWIFKFPIQSEAKAIKTGEDISGIRGILVRMTSLHRLFEFTKTQNINHGHN